MKRSLILIAALFWPTLALADAGLGDAGASPEAGTPLDGAPPGNHLPEGHRPEVVLRLVPEEGLSTGDVLRCEIRVELPEGDDINLLSKNFTPFELLDQRFHESKENGKRKLLFELDLLALEPGEHRLSPLLFRVITKDGQVGNLEIPIPKIKVNALTGNEPNAQPRPPTQPIPVFQEDYTILYVLGVLAIIAITALITWRVFRYLSQRPKAAPPPPPPRPAHEIALETLRALRKELEAALASGNQAKIIDGVSDAIRIFLGQRYGFNGIESTTDEVLAQLKDKPHLSVPLPEIALLLGECDLVKFAKHVPNREECERAIDRAQSIIERIAFMPPSPPLWTSTTKESPSDSPNQSLAKSQIQPSFSPLTTQHQPNQPPASPTIATPPISHPPPSTSPKKDQDWNWLEALAANDQPINGSLLGRVPGGFRVRLERGFEGFLPDAHVEDPEPDRLIGKLLSFRILALHVERERIILSRRGMGALDSQAGAHWHSVQGGAQGGGQ
ncbi:MAG: hypothetical protein NZM37_04535 [Sandaracinaceae bacterium]|nr:hypothetical protein [Sandaracinaceae bacterium]